MGRDCAVNNEQALFPLRSEAKRACAASGNRTRARRMGSVSSTTILKPHLCAESGLGIRTPVLNKNAWRCGCSCMDEEWFKGSTDYWKVWLVAGGHALTLPVPKPRGRT